MLMMAACALFMGGGLFWRRQWLGATPDSLTVHLNPHQLSARGSPTKTNDRHRILSPASRPERARASGISIPPSRADLTLGASTDLVLAQITHKPSRHNRKVSRDRAQLARHDRSTVRFRTEAGHQHVALRVGQRRRH